VLEDATHLLILQHTRLFAIAILHHQPSAASRTSQPAALAIRS
jgi:hypothetical protein